mgnify:CR=1 FL=1
MTEAVHFLEVGMTFDELKDKRDSVRQKAELLESLRAQIYSLDLKTEELLSDDIPDTIDKLGFSSNSLVLLATLLLLS